MYLFTQLSNRIRRLSIYLTVSIYSADAYQRAGYSYSHRYSNSNSYSYIHRRKFANCAWPNLTRLPVHELLTLMYT